MSSVKKIHPDRALYVPSKSNPRIKSQTNIDTDDQLLLKNSVPVKPDLSQPGNTRRSNKHKNSHRKDRYREYDPTILKSVDKFSRDQSEKYSQRSKPSFPKPQPQISIAHDETTSVRVAKTEEIQKPKKLDGSQRGIIRIPQNVKIFDHLNGDEPSDIRSRNANDRNSDSFKKPIMVVRPNLPNSNKSPLSDTSTLESTMDFRSSGNQPSVAPISIIPISSTAVDIQNNQPTGEALNYLCQLLNRGQITNQSNPTILSKAPSTSTAPIQLKDGNMSKRFGDVMQQIMDFDRILGEILRSSGFYAHAITNIGLGGKGEPQQQQSQIDYTKLVEHWWNGVDRLRCHLFSLYQRVILTDLDFCNTAHVEQGMWKSVFYTVIESLRYSLSNPQASGWLPASNNTQQDQDDASCHHQQLIKALTDTCLNKVIGPGEQVLEKLLDQLQRQANVDLNRLLACDRPPPETQSRSRRLLYISAQKLMLFLGDLARYRGLMTGHCNFAKARRWYHKAQLIIPKNGRSYNQLAVLAVYTSRHMDAMYYFTRTLATNNPFTTASQSLTALFHEIYPRADRFIRHLEQSKKSYSGSASGGTNQSLNCQRVEIWVHPTTGHINVLRGIQPLTPFWRMVTSKRRVDVKLSTILASSCRVDDNENGGEDVDEESQAELEEYANTPLVELSKQLGFCFIHAHGKLFNKVGMENYPEVASLALQAFSGLLAQNPIPLSIERLCQLCIVNMHAVEHAKTLTTSHQRPNHALRSVHHDHAARFTLDVLGLLCRRASQLLAQQIDDNEQLITLPADCSLLLAPLRLLTEWLILHPEDWQRPLPLHRDPQLRPRLDECQLLAQLCTQCSRWLARLPFRPSIDEVTPTTSLVMDADPQAKEEVVVDSPSITYLFEEAYVAGFKPMLDLVPKMYRCRQPNFPSDLLADYVRVEKLILFGDYLCGIDPPLLTFNTVTSSYEPAAMSSYHDQRRQVTVKQPATTSQVELSPPHRLDEPSSTTGLPQQPPPNVEDLPLSDDSSDIEVLRRRREQLQQQLEAKHRLAEWRRNAIKTAARGSLARPLELEVRPIYLLPDTNCYIDWVEGIATLAQQSSSNYTILVPIIVVNELDSLARQSPTSADRTSSAQPEPDLTSSSQLVRPRAQRALAFLEHQFASRNQRLRALTARGNLLDSIAYRNEVNRGRQEPGQTNDDVILNCCTHFARDDSARLYAGLHNYTAAEGLDESASDKVLGRAVGALKAFQWAVKEREPVGADLRSRCYIMEVDPIVESHAGLAGTVAPSYSQHQSTPMSMDAFLGPVDQAFKYDAKAHQSIVNAKPWLKDPNYFKAVKISALALLKMLLHAKSGGQLEIMGIMLGKVTHNTMIVVDCCPLPVEGTETRVNAQAEAYEFMTCYKEAIVRVGRTENVLGWYHSHPGYGCWLSGIDVATQHLNQSFQEPFLAIVIDPIRTLSSGKVDLGAFRTYPSGYQPPDQASSEYQSIPIEKIEDFGVHCKQYYSLDVSFFKSSLDKILLNQLWNKYWVNTLSSNTILAQPDYLAGLTRDLAGKIELAVESVGRVTWDHDGLEDKLIKCSKDATKMATEQLNALMTQLIKDNLFAQQPSLPSL